ncbi:abscission/NoCut checkpoint regulator isoform X2 [Belonocnema kinseyi]|uniref:abscission/NoCut checkpoint regulator isoform X2 n=1 Tax=Belonocnema kinseyi TaxID=2817044 RepID=UPI00143CD4A2|nr:abscission/NoCut checkpoint regulator isoform X2 [Belonocnema kinseyi]
MSCNTCQSKFSLFTRENACPNCGFSFCSKCLKYKCELPNVGMKKVCGRCFSKHESKKDLKPVTPKDEKSILDTENPKIQPLAPIDITNKLESLENPAKPPIVMYAHGGHWEKLKRGLEPVDQEIVERLRKLKGEDSQVSPPSVEDIKRRLALLKDQDPDRVNKPMHYVDTRTDQEKTDDLIKEYLERLELSGRNDPVSEIQSRLDHLKGFDPSKSSSSKQEDEDEEDRTITKKIIKKALAEAALERKYDDVDELEEMEVEAVQTSTDNEDNSCVMCDQTADLVNCIGCHGDLYCTICFEDNHDDFELGKHKTAPFKSTKRSKSD